MERFKLDNDLSADARGNPRSRRAFVTALGATATAALAGCGAPSGQAEPDPDVDGLGTLPEIVTMYKSPACGCCDKYAEYLSSVDGIGVSPSETDDLSGVKSDFDVPEELESCHTIDAGEYVIEGHVPFDAVKKLATEQPDVRGIALPEMPAGSPGMGGSKNGKFTVYAFYEDREPTEFVSL